MKEHREFLRNLFASDQDLLDKYHIVSGQGLDACVDRTISDLEKAKNFSFHKITVDNKEVGFFGKESFGQDWLTGFFLVPEYRGSKGVEIFKDRVFAEFSPFFMCGLYTKNTRAINFIKKLGGHVVFQNDEQTILGVSKE